MNLNRWTVRCVCGHTLKERTGHRTRSSYFSKPWLNTDARTLQWSLKFYNAKFKTFAKYGIKLNSPRWLTRIRKVEHGPRKIHCAWYNFTSSTKTTPRSGSSSPPISQIAQKMLFVSRLQCSFKTQQNWTKKRMTKATHRLCNSRRRAQMWLRVNAHEKLKTKSAIEFLFHFQLPNKVNLKKLS